jgi:hypothetical protein
MLVGKQVKLVKNCGKELKKGEILIISNQINSTDLLNINNEIIYLAKKQDSPKEYKLQLTDFEIIK